MVRALVTQALVDTAARELIAKGDEITIKSIQAHIGGGSFSTVKRDLDVWRERREKEDPAIADLPPEVEARGRELVALLWGQASRLAVEIRCSARGCSERLRSTICRRIRSLIGGS